MDGYGNPDEILELLTALSFERLHHRRRDAIIDTLRRQICRAFTVDSEQRRHGHEIRVGGDAVFHLHTAAKLAEIRFLLHFLIYTKI